MDHPVFASWRLARGVPGQEESLVPEDMKEFRRERQGEEEVCIWKGCTLFGPDFQVTTRWKTVEDGLKQGQIFWEGGDPSQEIETVDFPVRTCPFPKGAEILYGSNDTGVVEYEGDYLASDRDIVLERPCLMLWAILQPDNTGNYFDVRDPERRVSKTFVYRISQEKRNILCRIRTQIEILHADKGGLPYPVTTGDYEGNWFEAGQFYRKWAVQQWWFTARKTENPLREIGMWVWNRGLARDVIPPVVKLQEDLPGVRVALDWYWWHSNSYDTDYPRFWPPREGVENFRRAVADAKAKGIFTQVYINGVCADVDSSGFTEEDEKELLVNRDGTHRTNAFNQWNHHRLGWNCGEAPRFQEKICRLVDHLAESGLDGQYIDQIAFSTARLCYSPHHSHNPGGGTYVEKLWRDYLQRIRKSHPEMPLSSEGCTEGFMDLFDGVIVCGSISTRLCGGGSYPVPLFPSVYHGRNAMALFGNYALPDGIPPWDPLWPDDERWTEEKEWHEIYPEQFFIEVLRDVIWGIQPMVCNLTSRICTDPKFQEIYRFILHAAKFYHDNREFLFDGEMLNPKGFVCEKRVIKMLRRGIFTHREDAKESTLNTPVILHALWRSPAGKTALFMGNLTEQAQKWNYGDRSGILNAHTCEKVIL